MLGGVGISTKVGGHEPSLGIAYLDLKDETRECVR